MAKKEELKHEQKAAPKKIERVISIDAGRSGVKCCYYDNGKYYKTMFSAKHGIIDFNHFKTLPILSFNPTDEFTDTGVKLGDTIASVDDTQAIAVGDLVDSLLPPDSVIFATSDEIYLEFCINYILTMLGKIANDKEEVTLAINLTFNNDKFGEKIKEQLKGVHNVKFYDPKGRMLSEKTFNVKRLTILTQGWSSIMVKYINPDLTMEKKYLKDGLIVDIGRKTVDIVFSRQCNPVKGISYEYGTEYIYSLISQDIFTQHNLKKHTMDIEAMIMNGDLIYDRKGSCIDPKIYLKNAIISIANKIRTKVIEDFGDYSFQWVLLTGGGSFYFKDVLSQVFPQMELMEDPQYSNSLGMTKFVVWNLSN